MENREFLNVYAEAARKYPLLTAEQEAELYAKGTPRARQRLVECNLRLVLKMANRYAGRNGSRLLEFVQQGNLGLCEAAQTFDPSKGRFTTHAGYGIKGRILGFIMTTARVVRVGITTETGRKVYWNVPGIRGSLEAQGIEATPERIAKELDLDPDDVRDLLVAMSGSDKSTCEAVAGSGGSDDEATDCTLGDTLESREPDPETVASGKSYRQEIQERIQAFRGTLTTRQAEVLDRRILNPDPPTLAAVGKELGCTREAIRQTEKRVKELLQLELDDLYDEIKAG